MIRAIIYFFVVIILLLTGCDSSKVYEEHINTDNLQWYSNDIKQYTVSINDTTFTYDLYAAVRYIENCPYPELSVKMTVKFENNCVADIPGVIIIKDERGNYIGDVSGNMWDCDDVIIDHFKFKHIGDYVITIQAVPAKDPYIMIQDVGLIVKKNVE